MCLRHSWVLYLLLLLQPCFYLQFWGLFDNNCFLKLGWNFTSLPLVDGIRVTASSLVRSTKGEVGGGCTRGRGGCQFSSSAFYSFFIFLFFLRAKPQPQVLNIISKVHKLCLRTNQVGNFLGSGMTGIKALEHKIVSQWDVCILAASEQPDLPCKGCVVTGPGISECRCLAPSLFAPHSHISLPPILAHLSLKARLTS